MTYAELMKKIKEKSGGTWVSRRYKATVTGIIPLHLVEAKYPELYCSWQCEVGFVPSLYRERKNTRDFSRGMNCA